MNPALLPLQAQQNAKMAQDAFADLAGWTSSIKEKDKKLKTSAEKGKKAVDEIRSKRMRKKHVVKVDSDGSEIESEGEADREEEERLEAAEEYKNIGNEHFKNKRYKEAIESYTMASSLDVSNPTYPANRAMTYMKLEKYSEAEEDCSRAIKHDPTYEKALFRRAQCRNFLGKLEGAKLDYQAVLKINPKNKLAKKELSEIEARLHQKVKWTFERPKSASKIKHKIISITEKNKPEKFQQSNLEDDQTAKSDSTEISMKVIENIENWEEENNKNKTENNITENIPNLIEEIEDKIEEKTEKKIEPESMKEGKHTLENQDEKIEDVKFDFSKPGNSFELERDWRSIKSLSGKAKYLRIDESDRLAALFAPQLPKFLVEICSALLYSIRNSDEKEAIRYCETFLRSISSLPRFQTALFFLMDEERRVISDLFEILKSRGSSSDLARLYHV